MCAASFKLLRFYIQKLHILLNIPSVLFNALFFLNISSFTDKGEHVCVFEHQNIIEH